MSSASELIYVMGAMLIFALTTLNFNRMVLMHTTVDVESRQTAHSLSLGNRLVQQARTNAFDEQTIGAGSHAEPASMTSFGEFGPEDGETSGDQFDDFDDYHGYTRQVDDDMGSYELSIEVCYVGTDYDECIGGPTRFKKMEVTVQYDKSTGTSDNAKNSLKLSYVKGYYH